MEDSRTLIPLPAPQPTELGLEELLKRASEYALAGKCPATIRAYDSAWRSFCEWTANHQLRPLPADPATVATYLADQAMQLVPGTLTKILVAISQAHQLAGVDDPTLDPAVKAVMRGIRRQHGRPPEGKDPLLVGDVISIVQALDISTMAGLRDRALLLLGFAGALRRSELVAIERRDLKFKHDGLALTVRRSKTDQEGHGRAIGIGYGHNGTCPVVAVRSWLTAAGIESGPVLRPVGRHDDVRERGLSGKAVSRIVKRLVPLAGLDPTKFGGHSLRSGFATSAAAAGIAEREIALVTRHRSLVVLRRYIREGTLFDGDFSRRLGL